MAGLNKPLLKHRTLYIPMPSVQLLIKPFEAKIHIHNKLLNNSVRTAKKTQSFSVTEVNSSILFIEKITVNLRITMKPLNTLCGRNAEILLQHVVHIVTTWF
jgi:hypothetical protein